MYQWTTEDTNSFYEKLEFEAAQQKEIAFFYEKLQNQLKGSFTLEVVDFHKNKECARLQKKGVDTILHLESGNKVYVQEKHIRNKDSVYLEYEKPNGSVSWALDSRELSHLLVFHFTNYGMALSVHTQKLVKLVSEMLPIWKVKYIKKLAIHDGHKGITIPLEELMQYEEQLGLKMYFKSEHDRICYEIDQLFS